MWAKSFQEPGRISPPNALAISSSCVQLDPGRNVGEHDTGGREELIFVFEGTATLRMGDDAAPIPAGHAAYVPPNTRHDVLNEGTTPLRYAYVTAKVGKT